MPYLCRHYVVSDIANELLKAISDATLSTNWSGLTPVIGSTSCKGLKIGHCEAMSAIVRAD
jgi:hypothetical protein